MRFYVWIAGICLGLLTSGLSFNVIPANGPRKYELSVNYWKQSGTSNQAIPASLEKRPRSYGLSVNYWKQSSGESRQTSSSIAAVGNDGSACAAETYVSKLSNSGGKPTRSYGLSSNNWKKANGVSQQTTTTFVATAAATSSSEKTVRSYGVSSSYWKTSTSASNQATPTSATSVTNEKPARSYGLSSNYWKKTNSQQIPSSPSSPFDSSIDNNPKPKKFLSDRNKELLFSLVNVAAIGYVAGILLEVAMNILKAKRSGLIPI